MCFVNTWEVEQAHRIGREVQRLRKAAGLTAQQLGDRTEERGLKMTRQAISDLENGRRRYVTTAELIVIAASLNTSPVNLVYPGPYDAKIELLPGAEVVSEYQAAEWFSGVDTNIRGHIVGPSERMDEFDEWRSNTDTLRQWRELDELLITRANMDNPDYIATLNRQIQSICDRLRIKFPSETAFGPISLAELLAGRDDA